MTDDEINIALCKWDGWREAPAETLEYIMPPAYGASGISEWIDTNGNRALKKWMPRYTSSLDALAPLEAKLTDEQNRSYAKQILIVLGIRNVTSDGRLINGSDLCAEEWMKCVRATAAQKARALVRALGLDGREGGMRDTPSIQETVYQFCEKHNIVNSWTELDRIVTGAMFVQYYHDEDKLAEVMAENERLKAENAELMECLRDVNAGMERLNRIL